MRCGLTVRAPTALVVLLSLIASAASVVPLSPAPQGPPASTVLADFENSVTLGDRAFFFADTAGLGTELWTSDGTSEGTRLVIDLDPGPFGNKRRMTNWNGQLAFGAHDGVWVSDGTREGTRRIARAHCEVLLPFAGALLCGGVGLFRIAASGEVTALETTHVGGVSQIVPFAGAVWFIGTDGMVWSTDGTPAGTLRFKSLLSRRLTVADQRLFIIGSDSSAPIDGLWVTDGTLAGTSRLRDARHDGGRLLVLPGEKVVYFSDQTGLWVANGSLTTQLGTFQWPARVVGDRIYFPADDFGLLTSEGGGPVVRLTTEGQVSSMAPLGTQLLFTVVLSGVEQLFKTDGTPAGTVGVTQVRSDGPLLHFGFSLGSHRYFPNRTAAEGSEVWRTDGTPAGTTLFAELSPGVIAALDRELGRPVQLSPALMLFQVGPHLWRTDGTANATSPLTPIDAPEEVAVFGGRALYPSNGTLWTTDGTLSGSRPLFAGGGGPSGVHELKGGPTKAFFLDDLKQLQVTDGTEEGTFSPLPLVDLDELSMLGDTAFFLRADPGQRLWSSDGTSVGTVPVFDFSGSSVFWLPNTPEGNLLFEGGPPPGAWRSNGTTEGTTFVGPVPQYVQSWMSLSRRTLAIIHDEQGSQDPLDDTIELWSTDETGANFARVKRLAVAPVDDDFVHAWTKLGDFLYFVFDDGLSGRELWRTDGTLAGTARLTDLAPGPLNGVSMNSPLLNAGGWLWFAGSDGVHGCELWRTDGTVVNTQMVIDANPGERSFCPTFFGRAGTTLLVAADQGNGPRLFALSEPDAGSPDAGIGPRTVAMDIDPSTGLALPALRRGCGCSGGGEWLFGLAVMVLVLGRRVARSPVSPGR